ncbi:hypothetical protein F4778DRAFT_730187 [Xylariomycetidae sp. FL2044]|nr:hypothetical protein F4778DRAFT_730187 [Xylariomycetidae sp. FL2044]
MKLLRVARYLRVVLLFVVVASVLLFSLPKTKDHAEITHHFGIGIDLSPSYATVAVSYPNGSTFSIARVDGDGDYREMMLRLSLPSSQHLHRPYDNVGDAISDSLRTLIRDTRKKLGLPASKDVGTLSNMIRALREKAAEFVGEPISAASMSIPHLVALYSEDLYDAFEYLLLSYVEFYPFNGFNPMYTSTAAYAGNGLGLCRHYRDPDACREEESHFNLRRFALSVSYTKTSLTCSQAEFSSAYHILEGPTLEDLRLGSDSSHEEHYWDSVRDELRYPVVTSPLQRNITIVLLVGDATDQPTFREVLREVIDEVISGEPEILDRESEFIAARGTAEMGKRAIFEQTRDEDAGSEL